MHLVFVRLSIFHLFIKSGSDSKGLESEKYSISEFDNISAITSMSAFQLSVNCDIIPCKARDIVVQKRRFRLGNLI
jgi:hypothetical protein